MYPQYTELFSTLLENKGYNTQEQDIMLTEILTLIRKIPNFKFGQTIDFNFEKLFIDKYDVREIGSESEELFMHYWREKTNEIIIKYVPKIQMWLDNFNDLFKFTVKLTINDTNAYEDNEQNTYYLNPTNATTENLKVQDVDKSKNSGGHSRIIERDALQTVWGKTRADIMAKIFELTDIYNEALIAFDKIFMGVF